MAVVLDYLPAIPIALLVLAAVAIGLIWATIGKRRQRASNRRPRHDPTKRRLDTALRELRDL